MYIYQVEYIHLKKIKPLQNAALILGFTAIGIAIPLFKFLPESYLTIPGLLTITGFIFHFFFGVLSIPFLISSKAHRLELTETSVVVKKSHNSLDEVTLVLNKRFYTENEVSVKEILTSWKSIPKWGNFLILESGERIEVKKDENLKGLLPKVKVLGVGKQSFLYKPTWELFKSLNILADPN